MVELDAERMLTRNSYEICTDGIPAQMGGLQAVPYSSSDYWYSALISQHYFILKDVSKLDESQSELRRLLEAQGIRSIILAPLWRDGALLGFVGVDNPSKAIDQTDRLTALSDYIAVLLTRRDLSRRIERDGEMLRSLPIRLLDNLPNGAALYRFDGKSLSVVHINKRYWKLVQRPPVDYSKASVFGVIHPDDRDLAYQEIQSAIRQDREAVVDLRILCGKDTYKPFRIVANISREAEGSYLVYASYTLKAERGMSIQEMIPIALSTVMSSSDNLSYVKGKDMRYICVSQSAADMAGLSAPKEMVGKTAGELFNAEFARQFDLDDEAVLATGSPVVGKVESAPFADGSVHTLRTSKYPVKDASGGVIGVYCLSADITAQQEKESQLELLTNSIPGGLAAYLLTDSGPKIRFFTDGFYEFSGCTREEYMAASEKDAFAFVFEEDRPAIETVINDYIEHKADGRTGSFVFRCHTKAGGYRWLTMKTLLSRVGENRYVINAVLLDITEQHEAQERLRVSEELNRLALEHSGSIITRFDVKTRTLTMPEKYSPIFDIPNILYNVPREQIELGRISPETADAYTEMFESIVRGEPAGSAIYQQNSTKGWRWLDAQFTTVFSDSGKPITAVISFSDVTEQMEKELVYTKWQQSLTARPEDSYTLFRCNLSRGASYDSWEGTLLNIDFDDGKKTFDEKTAEYVSQCLSDKDRQRYLTFLNSDRLLAEYYRGHHSDVIEYRERTKNGAERWLRLTVDLVEYPNSKDIEIYLMFENIDEQKKADLLTLERAETDPLTGVLNRTAFISRMENALNSAKHGQRHALFMLDIDDFKQVNDTMGHSIGDDVLCRLTDRLRGVLRRDDLLGRLGGDEFFVLLIGIPDKETAARKAQQICSLKFGMPGANNDVTASMGIAMIPDDGEDFDTLYKKVDAALYRRKEQGKNGYLFVTE